MATRRQTSEVGELIRGRMTELRHSQTWLAGAVARELGEGPMTQTAVVKWLRKPETMPPARLFAIERVLGVRPGTWSRRLGYLPLSAKEASTVREAIEVDPALSESELGKQFVLGAYETVLAQLTQRRPDNPSAPRPRRVRQ